MPTKSSESHRRETIHQQYERWLQSRAIEHSPDNAAHFAASSTEHGTARFWGFTVGEVSQMLGGNRDWES